MYIVKYINVNILFASLYSIRRGERVEGEYIWNLMLVLNCTNCTCHVHVHVVLKG